MNSISDMPEKWAESDKKTEATAFEQALKRIKPIDNIHTAYQRGYEAGYKAAAKLLDENKQLREDNQKLREALMRTTTDRYEYE